MKLLEVLFIKIDSNKCYILADKSKLNIWISLVDGHYNFGNYNDLINTDNIDWIYPVLVIPENIGLISEKIDNDSYKFRIINDDDLNCIINNNGKCKIEIQDNIENYVPILVDNKIIIHL